MGAAERARRAASRYREGEGWPSDSSERKQESSIQCQLLDLLLEQGKSGAASGEGEARDLAATTEAGGWGMAAGARVAFARP